jgi:hypothetical protein
MNKKPTKKNSLFDLKLYALNAKKMIIVGNPTWQNTLSEKGFRGFFLLTDYANKSNRKNPNFTPNF